MQNIVILAGNIGQSPEVRTTQGGTKITNFTLATSRPRLVDFHPEVTRVFHRELTRLKVMFCGLCWGQDMRGLPFGFGYC